MCPNIWCDIFFTFTGFTWCDLNKDLVLCDACRALHLSGRGAAFGTLRDMRHSESSATWSASRSTFRSASTASVQQPGHLLAARSDARVGTAQFNIILNESSVIIIQIRVNMCLLESVPRIIPHLETRTTDTLFIQNNIKSGSPGMCSNIRPESAYAHTGTTGFDIILDEWRVGYSCL